MIAHPLSERGHDLYETPSVATEALLRAEDLPGKIWEPACGPGSIVKVLREAGKDVFAADLVDYQCPGQWSGVDFLATTHAPAGVNCIVTNPPFKYAGQFVKHGLALCPHVIMLLRLAFLESERRRDILECGSLARVHVFRNRLPMMHRDGWTGPKTSSTTAFAWFVWDRSHFGSTELRRISWLKD